MNTLNFIDYQFSRLLWEIPWDWAGLAAVAYWSFRWGEHTERMRWKMDPITKLISREAD